LRTQKEPTPSTPPDWEIWHPYWLWEEFPNNMWGNVKDRKSWLQKAIEFTGDHVLYGSWMMRVANEWKFSCEQNLTKRDMNMKAWIGHAAVAMAIQCPEDIVREAWGYLTKEQQDMANDAAQRAIDYWKERQCQKED
jgi:hypothetical protein